MKLSERILRNLKLLIYWIANPKLYMLERVEELYGKEVRKEVEKALVLKELADVTNLPVIIEIPSLRISYQYDPLDRKKKNLVVRAMKQLLRNMELKDLYGFANKKKERGKYSDIFNYL